MSPYQISRRTVEGFLLCRLAVFGRPFVKRFALCHQTVVCPALSVCPVMSVTLVYCGIGRSTPTELGLGSCELLGQPKRHCVRWVPSSPTPKGDRAPQFSAHVYYDQTAGWIKIPLGTEVALGTGHIVQDRDPAPPPPRGTAPNFWTYLLWPKGWIKMSLG